MSNLPTKEERALVRESILLTTLMTMIENNRQHIEANGGPLRKLYEIAAQALLERVHTDLAVVRKALMERKMLIVDAEKIGEASFDKNTLYYDFYCRGYHEKMTLSRDLVRSEMGVRLGRYIAELGGRISAK